MVPGILKTIQNNKSMSMKDGLKLFEISDVVLLDPATDVGARNVRRLSAVYTGNTDGFEIIHGLVDRVMQLLDIGCTLECQPQDGKMTYTVQPSSGKSTYNHPSSLYIVAH